MSRSVLLALAFVVCVPAQTDTKPVTGGDPVMPADTEIKTTPSGLKYSVLKAGKADGRTPGPGDKVRVHYSGWLTDGKLFDSSVKRGQPFDFSVGSGVIQGWSEAAQLMTEGQRIKVTIPPNLGYGERGSPPVIPANATLVFEIELLDILAIAPKLPESHADKQKTTASGLKYEVIQEGSGDSPKEEDTWELKYAFWNGTGKLIDSSEANGRPFKGSAKTMRFKFLQEAPALMKVGSKVRFDVPPELLFGAQARGPDLPANSATVWLLELVQIVKPLPIPEFAKSDPAKLQKTASGLQYEVIKEGTGKTPTMGQKVTVHYAGWLMDGKLFDSSFGRGEPMSFTLGAVIKGWNEGLQMMKEGSIYKLTIPPELAYGSQGAPPTIPAEATLLFYVELIKVGE